MSSFSAVDSAFSGFSLITKRPMLILAWSGLYLLAGAVLAGLAFLLAGPSLMSLGSMGDDPDPAAVVAAFSGLGALLLLLFPALIIMSAVFLAAVYRSIIRPEEKKFAYVALGGDEWRLVLLGLAYFALYILVVAIFAGVIFGASLVVGETMKGLMIFLAILGGIVGFIFLGVRLSLSGVQTFAEKRLNLFGSWRLTSGRFWPLLGMWVLAVIVAIGVSLLVAVVSYIPLLIGGGLGAVAQTASPDFETMTVGVIIGMIFYLAIQLVGSVVQSVLMYAPAASAYRQLVPDVSTSDVFT
jgi:hypothetical protein